MCENWNAECVKLDVIRTPVSQHERPDLSSVQRCSAQSSRVPGTRRSSSCLLLLTPRALRSRARLMSYPLWTWPTSSRASVARGVLGGDGICHLFEQPL